MDTTNLSDRGRAKASLPYSVVSWVPWVGPLCGEPPWEDTDNPSRRRCAGTPWWEGVLGAAVKSLKTRVNLGPSAESLIQTLNLEGSR